MDSVSFGGIVHCIGWSQECTSYPLDLECLKTEIYVPFCHNTHNTCCAHVLSLLLCLWLRYINVLNLIPQSFDMKFL